MSWKASLQAALMLSLVALAGCASESDGPTPDDGVDGEEGAAVSLPAPAWAIGDWWTYETPGGRQTVVVTGDQGGDWIVDTTDDDLAFFDARFDISYLGQISKAQLDGSQQTGRVKYFDFPLENLKTWTTTWDDQRLDMIAHDRGDETFHIQAEQDGVIINQFLYSNASKWFEWISFGDAEGQEVWRMDLVDSGSGFSGQYVRVEPELVDEIDLSTPRALALYSWSPTPDSDVYLEGNFRCETGAHLFAVGPAESIPTLATQDDASDGFSEYDPCPDEYGFGLAIGDPNVGTWGSLVAVASPDAEGQATVWLRHFERISL